VQDGVSGEVDQITAINEWNDFHTRRQDVMVQFLDFLVNSLQSRVRCRAFPQQHNARHHVVVVYNLSVLAVNAPGKLPEADLRTLRDHGNVLHP